MANIVAAVAVVGSGMLLTLATGAQSAERQVSAAASQAVAAQKPPAVLQYGDGTPDGKKSIAGAGEMIHFEGPQEKGSLTGIALHGSRYGLPQAPPRRLQNLSRLGRSQPDTACGASSVRTIRARRPEMGGADVSKARCGAEGILDRR